MQIVPFKDNLDHAIRCWKAEEENARRLAQRTHILYTATLGFFGVALARVLFADIPESLRQFSNPLAISLTLALGLGLIALVASCALTLDLIPRKRSEGPASSQLPLPGDYSDALEIELESILDDESSRDEKAREKLRDLCRYLAALSLEDARSDLLKRNAREAQRVVWAQKAFVVGLFLIALCTATWVYNAVGRS